MVGVDSVQRATELLSHVGCKFVRRFGIFQKLRDKQDVAFVVISIVYVGKRLRKSLFLAVSR